MICVKRANFVSVEWHRERDSEYAVDDCTKTLWPRPRTLTDNGDNFKLKIVRVRPLIGLSHFTFSLSPRLASAQRIPFYHYLHWQLIIKKKKKYYYHRQHDFPLEHNGIRAVALHRPHFQHFLVLFIPFELKRRWAKSFSLRASNFHFPLILTSP